jgi:hypothetical protein
VSNQLLQHFKLAIFGKYFGGDAEAIPTADRTVALVVWEQVASR